jgi:hypothetical protein
VFTRNALPYDFLFGLKLPRLFPRAMSPIPIPLAFATNAIKVTVEIVRIRRQDGEPSMRDISAVEVALHRDWWNTNVRVGWIAIA